jgi:hypothetical protein
LDVEKIPVEVWGMLLSKAQPMRAPQLVWLAFFDLAVETPVSSESMVSMLDRKVDAELAGMRKQATASLTRTSAVPTSIEFQCSDIDQILTQPWWLHCC